MRQGLALSLWLVALGGCFEESNPVDETGAMQSSGEECTPGTESCPCIEGGCVNDLVCLSNVCVDAGSTSAETSEPETTSATSTSGPTSSTSVGTTPMTSDGPLDEGPVTSDSSGGLPQGAPCDPFADECQPGLACVGADDLGIVCDVPGPGVQGDACEMTTCAAGLLCMQAQAVGMCNSMIACCSALCDANDGNAACPMGLACEPFYPPMQAPPGYESVGVCVLPG